MSEIAKQYSERSYLFAKLESEVLHQINSILCEAKVTLANPVEHRVKTLDSILSKIQRRSISSDKNIMQIPDLIGFRIVLLFKRDLFIVNDLVNSIFAVLHSEDTSSRLSEGQFGYQSYHYICRIPPSWTELPSFRDLENMHFEIQVRTVSQHIWAAASHILQYKQESSVPLPLRRTIHRVAALLETVDLEFERVLIEREKYESEPEPQSSDELNVITLAQVLKSFWPPQNAGDEEPYAELMESLESNQITSKKKLIDILDSHKDAALEFDKSIAQTVVVSQDECEPSDINRAVKGHYFTHVGLTRVALDHALGPGWSSREADADYEDIVY